MTLTFSAAELQSRELEPATLVAGVRSLREQGWLVIENAVPLPELRALAQRFAEDTPVMLDHALRQHGRYPSVYTFGNLQVAVPPAAVALPLAPDETWAMRRGG